MFNLIWNEWFRDENLQDSVTVDLDDGPDTHADYSLLRRGKRKETDQLVTTLAPEVESSVPVFGTTSGSGIGFSKSFVEHSIIIGLCSVRADLNYQQGLPRMFSRSTRWDFFWPALAHLGEQTVLQAKHSILEADRAFEALPSWVRERFQNSPHELLHATEPYSRQPPRCGRDA